MRVRIEIRKLCILLFQIAYIADAVLGSEPRLYILSKAMMVAFWGTMVIYIAMTLGGKVQLGIGFTMATAFTLFCAASYFWSYNKELASSQMTTQWQLFLLFAFAYLLIRQDGDAEPYFKAIYLAGFALLLFTIYRYGLSGFFTQMMSGNRMGREITNENTYGMAFSQALIIAYYYYLKKGNKIHLASIAMFIIFALSSGSKKALLMCVVGVVGMSLFYYGFRKIWKTLLVVAVIAVAGYYILQLPLFSVINDRLTSYFSGELNKSDQNRIEYIGLGIQLFKERPIAGWGLQNFRYVSGSGAYSHNNFIELLVSTGIIGFSMYYSLYIIAGWTMLKQFIRQKKTEILALLILMLISIVFGYGMVQFYSKGPWFFFAVLLAIADRRENERMG